MLLRSAFVRLLILAALLILLSSSAVNISAQEVFLKNGDAWPVVPMSPQRSDDAYAIYSYLVPAEFPNAGIANKPLWLIANPTIVVLQESINPREGITAPPSEQQDMAAILADYDKHKFEHATLERNFHLSLPYRLLGRTEQANYIRLKEASDAQHDPALLDPFQGAQGILFFSNVYFNFDHTLAMVYVARWCGAKCGVMSWIALQKKNGNWNRLPWTTVVKHFE